MTLLGVSGSFGVAQVSVDLDSVIVFAGRWIFVPLMLVFLFLFSVYLAFQRAETPEQRWANIMGLVVGGVCFTIVVVLGSLGMLGSIGILEYEAKWAYFAFGALFGFVLLAVADKFLSSKTRSFFIMPVSAASLSGLYFYLISDEYRNAILLVLLGLLLGVVVYGWLFSTVFRDLIGGGTPARFRSPARGSRQ